MNCCPIWAMNHIRQDIFELNCTENWFPKIYQFCGSEPFYAGSTALTSKEPDIVRSPTSSLIVKYFYTLLFRKH